MKIAVVANSGWYLYNFRRNLLAALQRDGHTCVAVASDDAYAERLAQLGLRYRGVPFTGAGTNPLKELRTVIALRRVLRQERIDVVLSYTPKGNIYSAVALMGMRARLVTNVSGLGRLFGRRSLLTALVRHLYVYTFGRAAWVFFQNEDDRKVFVEERIVPSAKTSRLPGSGVDLNRFAPGTVAQSGDEAGPRFLIVARLLWDKGIGDFVDASRIVRASHPSASFRVLGAIDPPGPAAVSRATVDQWCEEGLIEYLGVTDDVRPHLLDADCVVLPSVYREGVPRSLLEAAAMGKPLIAADSIGCRDAIDHGVSGLLCRPRDVEHLAQAMQHIANLSPVQRAAMGAHGRAKMEREFDESFVIDKYLNLLRSLALSAAHRTESPPR